MTRSGPRGLTIADVARRAEVSLSTVSRVMNGNARVDPVLAERVRAAAEALNYTASPLARSLVLRTTQTIAIVVPDLGNPTFQGILRGLSRAAGRDGFHVLIADSAEVVAEERVLAIEARRRTDGIVLCAPRMPEDELARLLPALAPVVLVNRDPRSDTPVVAADYEAGLSELLQHLYDLGHRHLVYLAGVATSASNAHRLVAVAEFRRDHHDITIDELACGVGFVEGAGAVEAVLATGATGVLAFNDLVAMGLLSSLESAGVHVPADLSVVGFDDIPFARYTSPPLTTASVPVAELGEQAWASMLRLLNDQHPGHPTYFRPRVEVRGSSGPVPRRGGSSAA